MWLQWCILIWRTFTQTVNDVHNWKYAYWYLRVLCWISIARGMRNQIPYWIMAVVYFIKFDKQCQHWIFECSMGDMKSLHIILFYKPAILTVLGWKVKHRTESKQTLAVDEATPSPDMVFTAKALAIQDVIVSGMMVFTVTLPSSLKYTKVRWNLPNTGLTLDTSTARHYMNYKYWNTKFSKLYDDSTFNVKKTLDRMKNEGA